MEVLRKAFSQKLDPEVSAFVNCVDDDTELIQADIKGSLAHSEMLRSSDLLTEQQAANIQSGLNKLSCLYAAGELQLKPEFEDVHMNVEKQLETLVGQDALRLHTARSRNDQVAVDLRLFVSEAIEQNVSLLEKLQMALVDLAETNVHVVMPGYTHLQRAQPVLFAHALLAFVAMLQRDKERFADAKKRVMISPLGAGALAGSSLPIRPEMTAKLAGFETVFANSIDAVSDRDFIAEYLSTCAIASIHISQLCETFIVWATSEFSFIGFADNVTTASSLMPNKKNPDPLEIARAKSGSICGALINVLMVLKSLPLGYNRDLQDTKPPMIEATRTLQHTLAVVTKVLEATSVNEHITRAAASDPFVVATDLVEYLVKKGVPFRSAHEQVSSLLAFCRENGTAPNELSINELHSFAGEFHDDVFELFDPLASADAKTSFGGTASSEVIRVIGFWRSKLH